MDVKPASWISFPLVGQSETRGPSDSYFYMLIPDHFPGSVQCLFPVLPFYCLWPQNLYLIKLWHWPPPPTMRIIALKCNTDSLWSCFSLTPDAGNCCQSTVNNERTVQPNSHPRSLQNGISKHLQHLKTVGEEFWHQHVWHAALKTRSILTLYPTWLSLLEAGHVRETGNLCSTFKAMW